MTEYSVLHYAVLADSLNSDIEPEPWRRSSNAILSDGSVLVAAHYEDAPSYAGYGFLRVWHLAADLSLLGSLDIPTLTGGDDSLLIADDTKALLILPDYDGAMCTWEIDGSGSVPSILTSNVNSSISYGYTYFGTPHARLANGLAVVAASYSGAAGAVLQVFSGNVLLSELEVPEVNDTTGLWVSSVDEDHIAVTGRSYASGYYTPRPAHWREYSVSEAGFTLVSDNLIAGDPNATGYGDPFVALASGNPFLPDPTLLGIDTPDDMDTATYQVRGFDATTAVAETFANIAGGSNGSGQFIPGLDGRYATFATTYLYPDPSGEAQFVAVDPTVAPPTIEILTLPITGLTRPGDPDGLALIDPGEWQGSYDSATGIIAISATVNTDDGPNLWSVVVWLIQGPVAPDNLPNLAAEALTTAVHFVRA